MTPSDGFWLTTDRVQVDTTCSERKKERDKRPLEARCYSRSCNSKPGKYATSFEVKTVTKTARFCPDCRHALFWAIKGSKSGW